MKPTAMTIVLVALYVLAIGAVSELYRRDRWRKIAALRTAVAGWRSRLVWPFTVAHFEIAGISASLWIASDTARVRLSTPTRGRERIDKEVHPRLRAAGVTTVDLWPDAVVVSAPYDRVPDLRELVHHSLSFALDAGGATRPRGSQVLESTLSAGTCPVCCTAVTLVEWLCPNCSTPHHDECLRWVGRCCVYGCAGARGPSDVNR